MSPSVMSPELSSSALAPTDFTIVTAGFGSTGVVTSDGGEVTDRPVAGRRLVQRAGAPDGP